jgi:hypothetical protein
VILNENDLCNILRGKRVLLPVDNILSGEYPWHIASISNIIHQNGGSLTLLKYDNLERKIRKFDFRSRNKRNTRLDTKYFSTLSEKYATRIIMPGRIDLNKEQLDLIKQLKHLEDIKQINAELFYSVLSIWMSRELITLQKRDLSITEVKLMQNDVVNYFRAVVLVDDFVKENQTDLIIVPNGRYPHQVGIKHSAENNAIQYFHFERSYRGTNHLFFQSFQTHDLPKMSEFYLRSVDALTIEEREVAENWAELWLFDQERLAIRNPFIQFANSKEKLVDTNGDVGLVPIYTSSIDERFSNLGINLNGWESQNQAISAISKRIKSLGYSTIVRIHPNAGWKSWRELIELITLLKEENLSFILPWDTISSYKLMEKASFVVTWGSTLALESTARSITTYNLGFSKYDKLIDVEIISGEMLSAWKPNLNKKPSKVKSLLAIYITRNYGLKLEGQDWVYDLESKKSSIHTRIFQVRITLQSILDLLKTLYNPLNQRPYDCYFLLKRTLGVKLTHGIMAHLIKSMM